MTRLRPLSFASYMAVSARATRSSVLSPACDIVTPMLRDGDEVPSVHPDRLLGPTP